MTYLSNEDGITRLSRGERYRVSGYVTVKVPVCYTTTNEPGEDDNELWDAIKEVVGNDFDLVDSEELDYELDDL